jgi:radical SAM peptide maturase (CXXX-repeat target family)
MRQLPRLPNYNDYVHRLYPDVQDRSLVREVTFQITNRCNLCCDYCYEHHKGSEVMSLDTGKSIVDMLIQMWLDDKPGAFINRATKTIILDFIGGEPLLEPKLIGDICEYFFKRCVQTGCKLSSGARISISTNGQNYFEPQVQAFIRRYAPFLSLNVSIDGHKALHDAHRVDAAGNGSFDKAIKAYHAAARFGGKQTKMTFVPSSFPQISEAILFMLQQNPDFIAANYAYEPIYTPQDASVLYDQLKIVADHLIETRRVIACSILDHNIGYPVQKQDDKNYCGGSGNMLAFDPQGRAYPCLRYCPISIGEEKASKICIGDMKGIYNTPHTLKIRDYLDAITLSSQSTPECINCPVAVGCGWCSAYNYESTGDVNKRVTNICWAHKGRVLASCYYHNRRYLEVGDTEPKDIRLPEKDALQIISRQEWQMLNQMADFAAKEYRMQGGVNNGIQGT